MALSWVTSTIVRPPSGDSFSSTVMISSLPRVPQVGQHAEVLGDRIDRVSAQVHQVQVITT
jgi:hypothetical protein